MCIIHTFSGIENNMQYLFACYEIFSIIITAIFLYQIDKFGTNPNLYVYFIFYVAGFYRIL